VFSKVDMESSEIMYGLYLKEMNLKSDWYEQDLIAEFGFPNDITDGIDAWEYVKNQRDTFQVLRADLECSGRDGMYNEDQLFVVWDRWDVLALLNKLGSVLTSLPEIDGLEEGLN